MRDLDVAEVRRRDEVLEGVRVWSGRWCHRKKAGGVCNRYVARQYRTEWSEDAFCGTPGWGTIRLLLAVASLMRWMVTPGDFSTAFMHTPLLDSDEYWVEPPREVVPDKRYVWKLKKALNGLVAVSKRFQQCLFRLLRDPGFESCPLLPTLLRNPITGTIMVVQVNNPITRGSPGEAEKLFEALGMHIATRRVQALHNSEASVYLGTRLGSWRCLRKATSRASGPNVRRCLASRTSRTQRTMRSISGELHSIYRQIVGKVQYITPRRPDVMFALKEAARRRRGTCRSRGGSTGTGWAALSDTFVTQAVFPCTCSTLARREMSSLRTGPGCTETRWSTSCCLIFWRDVLLQAHSRTQVQTGFSSPESEFYWCCGAAAELLYFRGLSELLGLRHEGPADDGREQRVCHRHEVWRWLSAPLSGEVLVMKIVDRTRHVLPANQLTPNRPSGGSLPPLRLWKEWGHHTHHSSSLPKEMTRRPLHCYTP